MMSKVHEFFKITFKKACFINVPDKTGMSLKRERFTIVNMHFRFRMFYRKKLKDCN